MANEIDNLVSRLMKPTYVLNMARAGERSDSSWGKSCRVRAKKARQEIDRIVREYVGEEGP